MINIFKAQYIAAIQKYAKIFNQFLVAISHKKIDNFLKRLSALLSGYFRKNGQYCGNLIVFSPLDCCVYAGNI
jgi:hypothetical protein